MFGRFAVGLFSLASVAVEAAQPISDFFILPPAMSALYGDVTVKVKPPQEGRRPLVVFGAGTYRPKQGVVSLGNRSRVILRPEGNTRRALASNLLGDFYGRTFSLQAKSWHEKRLELTEFVPVNRERFVEAGTRVLLEGNSGDVRFDAWWTVRMGLHQTPDPGHQLLVVLLRYDHDGEKGTLGHFCFGLRKRGGDADGDLIFDFRAPWTEDREPTLLEGMNYGNKLILSGFTENLYDWLYTQTAHRHCMVDLWFLPLSREQVTLLQWFDEEVRDLPAGQFKGLRKNCASLGMAYLDRLDRVTQPILLGHGLADIPTATVDRVLARENAEEAPHIQIENITHEVGNEPTAKSEVRRAQPSRRGSIAFRRLREMD